MQTLLRRYSALSYFLIFQLLGLPVAVLAKDGPVPPNRLKVAVVELNDGKVKAETVEKVADTLRDECNRQEGFEVLSKDATQRFLESTPDLSRGEWGSNSLNRYLDQAKEFYKTFNFKEAISVLENTIDTFHQSSGTLTDPFALTDAYLMLGNVHTGNNDPRRAQEAFKEAVRLDPDREITELQYPPKTVAAFQQARAEVLKKTKPTSLEVQSSPAKAEVYVNGVLKGQTPLRLERLTAGDNFLLVRAPGYKPQALKLGLKPEGGREKFALQKLADFAVSRHGLNIQNLDDVSEQVRLGSLVGKSLGLDKVVLVSVQEIGWNNKITARMIDVRYQASHKPKSVEVLDLPKDTRSASHVIVEDIQQIARVDLAKDPKKYADSEVVVIGSKKKKSFLKSPWLWGLIGVAVAGGATGALLLGKGGGGSGGDNASAVSLSGAASRAP